jgi:hypothetical protein
VRENEIAEKEKCAFKQNGRAYSMENAGLPNGG